MLLVPPHRLRHLSPRTHQHHPLRLRRRLRLHHSAGEHPRLCRQLVARRAHGGGVGLCLLGCCEGVLQQLGLRLGGLGNLRLRGALLLEPCELLPRRLQLPSRRGRLLLGGLQRVLVPCDGIVARVKLLLALLELLLHPRQLLTTLLQLLRLAPVPRHRLNLRTLRGSQLLQLLVILLADGVQAIVVPPE